MEPGVVSVEGVEVLFTEEQIRDRVRALGEAITADYAGRAPVLISVLKGGTVFLADLLRRIHLPVRIDFMSISQYEEDARASGVVRIVKDLDQDIGDEDVVVVEDIIDTGLTLSYLLTSLWSRAPRSLEVCTLLDKSVRRIAPLEIRYTGFDCPDAFVVGYGLDLQERYRNLPFIVSLPRERLADADPDLLLPYLAAPGQGRGE
ncbi:MAG TPA: hypoxanthine phosphoribosyltransferase [Actinomycetota bacterium]|nr:hypoxanthine phosphoribosyltransferase [Actinomycetota bacterium]